MAVAALGGSIGAGVLFVDWPVPAEARAFTSTGEYALAVALVCAMTAAWAVAVLPLSASLRAVWPLAAPSRARIAAASAVLAVALGALFVGAARLRRSFEVDYPFPHREAKVAVLFLLGALVAGAAAVGMLDVHAAAARLARRELATEAAWDPRSASFCSCARSSSGS